MNSTETNPPTQKRWLTPDDLANEYGFSKSNQDKLRMRKKIPFSKIGRYVRYDRLEIDKWLENNKIEISS